MSIVDIEEIANKTVSKMEPIKEKQDIFVPGIVDQNIPSRNGFIDLMVGSGGTGKTSLSLNMFKHKNMYRGKFDNIFYICPEGSFLSAVNHPFKDHDKVFHELTVGLLEEIYQSLMSIKTDKEKKRKLKEARKRARYVDDDDVPSDSSDMQRPDRGADDAPLQSTSHLSRAAGPPERTKLRHVPVPRHAATEPLLRDRGQPLAPAPRRSGRGHAHCGLHDGHPLLAAE
jgi:hypothetical protein